MCCSDISLRCFMYQYSAEGMDWPGRWKPEIIPRHRRGTGLGGGSVHLAGDRWLPILFFDWHRVLGRSDGHKELYKCILWGINQLSRCVNISLESFFSFFSFVSKLYPFRVVSLRPRKSYASERMIFQCGENNSSSRNLDALLCVHTDATAESVNLFNQYRTDVAPKLHPAR